MTTGVVAMTFLCVDDRSWSGWTVCFNTRCSVKLPAAAKQRCCCQARDIFIGPRTTSHYYSAISDSHCHTCIFTDGTWTWVHVCQTSKSVCNMSPVSVLSLELAPCGPGAIPPAPYLFTSPLPTFCSVFSYLLLFSLFHSLCLFSCFSIPSNSAKIVPLHFQARCRRRRLNLDLVDF